MHEGDEVATGEVVEYDRGGYRPPSGVPARGGGANGSWEPLTAGPDGTAKAASEAAKEIGRLRKEASREAFLQEHQGTAKRMAKLQVKAIAKLEELFDDDKITAQELLSELKQLERPLEHLIGKPTQHTEATHEVNFTTRLRRMAQAPIMDDE